MTKHNKHWLDTHKRLKSIVLEEMMNKSLEQITVSSICRIAKINRSTFYEHYDDVFELMKNAKDETDAKLLDKFESSISNEHIDFLDQNSIVIFLNFVKEHGNFYKIRLRDEHAFSIKIIYGLLKKRIIDNDPNINESSIQYYIIAFQASFIGIVRLWAQNNYEEDVNTLARIIINSIPNLI